MCHNIAVTMSQVSMIPHPVTLYSVTLIGCNRCHFVSLWPDPSGDRTIVLGANYLLS